MKFGTAAAFAAALLTGVSTSALAQSKPDEPPAAPPPASLYYNADGTRTADLQAALASWRADPQFAVDYSKAFMGLEHAYVRGLSGRGVTIGINDSGVYTAHPLFGGQGKFTGLHTVVSNEYGNDGLINPRRPWTSHGTHVAGTAAGGRIAGERMFGNAYGANIYAATVNFAGGDPLVYRDAVLNNETVVTTNQSIIDLANTGRVRIINNSWGSSNSIPYDAARATVLRDFGFAGYGNTFQPVIDNNVLVVFSAGNTAAIHASQTASAPMWTDTLRPYWLSVVNYNSNVAPNNSNLCGQTATWCVVGPGTGIISSVPGSVLDAAAIRTAYRPTYLAIYAAPTVAALTTAVRSRFVEALNSYYAAKQAATAAGTPFDEVAARQEVARHAAAISLASGSRMGDASYFFGNLGDILTKTAREPGLTEAPTAEFARNVITLMEAEFQRILAPYIQYTGASYEAKNGTSMAAPNISGFAGLLMEQFPEYSTPLISDILVSSSRDLDAPGVDLQSGWGVPQMETALNGPTALRAVRDVTVSAGTVDIWSNNIGDARDRYSALVLAAYPDDVGGIVKKGGGELILSGTSNYSGVTRAEEGLLTVNGQFTRSNAAVAGVGIIGGIGRLFNLTAERGGVVAPGSTYVPFGTLTVDGNMTFLPGSYLWVRSAANAAANSKLVVGGTTDLKGGEVVLRADHGTWNIRSNMVILESAGALTGQFAGTQSNLAFLTPTLSYEKARVLLTLLRNDVTFRSVGQTPNQRATGGGLDAMPTKGALYDALVDGSVAAVQPALDTLSGETHASLAAVATNDTSFIRDAMLRRMPHSTMAQNDAGGATEARGASGLVGWGQLIAGFADHKGTANVAAVKSSTTGFMTGIDRASDNFNIGVAFGYLDTGVNVHRPGSGNNKVRSWHAGGYLGFEAGPLRLRGGGSYGWYTVRTGRAAAVNAFTDSLTDSYNARAWQVFGELGLGFEAGSLALEPYANLTRVDYRSQQIKENGGAAALSGRTTQKGTSSTLGLRAATQLPSPVASRGSFARVNVGWKHELDNDGALANLAFAGGRPFAVVGAVPGKDSMVMDAAVDVALARDIDFGLTYGGQFAERYMAHAVKATLQLRF